MIITKEKVNNVIIVFLSIFYMAINCFNLNINFGQGSFTVNFLFFVLVFLFILNIKDYSALNSKFIILFILELLFLVLSYSNNYSGFGSIVSIISFCLIIQLSQTIRINKKSKLIILLFSLLFWIISISTNYNLYSDINPNTSGFIVYFMTIITISLLYDFFKEKKIRKIILFFVLIVSYLSVIKYDCRNVMINLIMISLLNFITINTFFSSKKKLKTFIFWFLITIGSLLFTKLYLYLYLNHYSLNISALSSKKFYSGRQFIWLNLYNVLEKKWLFGIGSKSIYFPVISTHNYMLNVLALFGFPHFVFFIILIYNYIKCFFESKIMKKNIICFISIISLFIADYLEATFADGIQMFVLFILSIIFFSNDIFEIDNKEDKI